MLFIYCYLREGKILSLKNFIACGNCCLAVFLYFIYFLCSLFQIAQRWAISWTPAQKMLVWLDQWSIMFHLHTANVCPTWLKFSGIKLPIIPLLAVAHLRTHHVKKVLNLLLASFWIGVSSFKKNLFFLMLRKKILYLGMGHKAQR